MFTGPQHWVWRQKWEYPGSHAPCHSKKDNSLHHNATSLRKVHLCAVGIPARDGAQFIRWVGIRVKTIGEIAHDWTIDQFRGESQCHIPSIWWPQTSFGICLKSSRWSDHIVWYVFPQAPLGYLWVQKRLLCWVHSYPQKSLIPLRKKPRFFARNNGWSYVMMGFPFTNQY